MRAVTIKTRLSQLEDKLSAVKGGIDKLSNFKQLQLSSEVGFINYVTPFHITPLIRKCRKAWGKDLWLDYLKTLTDGTFWPNLSKANQDLLIIIPRKDKVPSSASPSLKDAPTPANQ